MIKKLAHKVVNRLTVTLNSQNETYHNASVQAAINSSRSNYSKIKSLSEADLKIYSQWGEDGILDFLCLRLGLERPYFLEVGAGEFQECNSRFMVEFRNASATLVDANSGLEEVVAKSSSYWKTHLYAVVTWVTTENINRIIQSAKSSMGGLDIFSLDLDGNDYWILEAADLSEFKIVVLEYNSIFGAELALSVPTDEQFDRRVKHFSWLYYGASLRAFVNLMAIKGFAFAGTNLVRTNAFFIKKASVSQLPFDLPSDLTQFTDCKIRESRDKFGRMNHLNIKDGVSVIKDMPIIQIINSQNSQETTIGKALGLS